MTYYTYHFKWPNTDAGVNTVQITGNFDNWQRTTDLLVKEADGFSGNIKVNEKQDLIFKFIINDNEWKVSGDYKIQMDGSGIENNFVHADELIAVKEFEHDNIENNVVDTAFEGESEQSDNLEAGGIDKQVETLETVVPEVEAVPESETVSETEPVPETEAIPEDEAVATPQNESVAPKAEIVTETEEPEIVSSESPASEEEETEIAMPEDEEPEIVPEPTVKRTENDEDKDLSQVLTSTSSFAAVSIPDTHVNNIDEEMEELDDDYDEEDDDDEDDFVLSKERYEIPDVEEEIDDQYNTPTTSAANSVIPSSSSKSKKTSLGNLKIDSKSSSPIKDHGKGLRVPGAFPHLADTANKVEVPEVKSPGRREGLISKFKSLFRY